MSPRIHFTILVVASATHFITTSSADEGSLELRVIDHDSQKPIAARMHLKDENGKVVKPPKTVFWNDHFVFDGKVVLKLSTGKYSYELEHGPEYRLNSGEFAISSDAAVTQTIELRRFVDMKKEGWWSGETHIHRPLADVPLLMRAEDLHVGPVITWWNNRNLWLYKDLPRDVLVKFDENRFYHVMAGEDERQGGALLYFNLKEPLKITGSQREYPSPVQFLKTARENKQVHVDIEKPFWWDTPVWVATEMVDSIGLANNHMNRDGMYESEAWGKPRDTKRLPSPRGNGQWTTEIYYHLLNCGVRIPPSAGSASGVLKNPVGYNRVYVHCGDELKYDEWWEGLRSGRVLITNGPMMRVHVNDQLPGHVFQAPAGKTVELRPDVALALRDEVDNIEIIKNGKVAVSVPLNQFTKRGTLPRIEFRESGWLLVRAVTDNTKTYRFASSGPYYVQIGDKRRISKQSAEFFLDWVNDRIDRVKLEDDAKRNEVLSHHIAARSYWQAKVDRANAN